MKATGGHSSSSLAFKTTGGLSHRDATLSEKASACRSNHTKRVNRQRGEQQSHTPRCYTHRSGLRPPAGTATADDVPGEWNTVARSIKRQWTDGGFRPSRSCSKAKVPATSLAAGWRPMCRNATQLGAGLALCRALSPGPLRVAAQRGARHQWVGARDPEQVQPRRGNCRRRDAGLARFHQRLQRLATRSAKGVRLSGDPARRAAHPHETLAAVRLEYPEARCKRPQHANHDACNGR